MTRSVRLLGVIAALSALLCAGCFKANIDVAVAPDQSTSARLAVGIDSSLADMAKSEGSFMKEPPGKNWTTREYKEDNWNMTEAVGHAGPGESLFPNEKDAPKLQVQLSQRRLSTRYNISMVTPEPPSQLTEAPKPAADEKPAEGAENPAAGELPDLSGLVGSMVSGMDISVSLAGPGEVVATTGEVAGPGKAVWKLSITDLQAMKTPPDFRLTTEIPNWSNLGNLASQLVMRGGPSDAGSRLASALQRGLLPNPPASAAQAEKLSAIDYLRLLEIIGKLDAGAGPSLTDVIVKQSRLNDQDVTGAKIAAVHAKLMKLDVGTLVEQSAINALSAALK